MRKITTIYTLMISAAAFSQVGIATHIPMATLDIVGKPSEPTVLDGVIAPRLTGEQLRAKTYTSNQKGALVYITTADTTPAGQTIDVTTEGYYYFTGTKWVNISSVSKNIYNTNGSLTDYRTLNINNNVLNFLGTQQKTYWSANGSMNQSNEQSGSGQASFTLYGGNNSTLGIQQFYNGPAQIITSGSDLLLGTSNSQTPSYIRFDTSAGNGAYGLPRMFINSIGNVKIGDDPYATEKLDVNGLLRVHNLPLNGATNAHHTISGSSASINQDQTFTATRTLVADSNGVIGYVNELPTTPGTNKIIVSANVPGTQNITNGNHIIGSFTTENIDIYSAWTDNTFTVPANQGGLYTINMQTSNTHATTSQNGWFTMAFLEKSTNGGTNYSKIIADTNSGLASTDVDNGNSLFWSGTLNAGDMVRVKFICSSTTNNIIVLGGITITKVSQ